MHGSMVIQVSCKFSFGFLGRCRLGVEKLSVPEQRNLFRAFDTDSSGNISLAERLSMLFSLCLAEQSIVRFLSLCAILFSLHHSMRPSRAVGVSQASPRHAKRFTTSLKLAEKKARSQGQHELLDSQVPAESLG